MTDQYYLDIAMPSLGGKGAGCSSFHDDLASVINALMNFVPLEEGGTATIHRFSKEEIEEMNEQVDGRSHR